MSAKKFNHVKLISAQGDEHFFADVHELGVNVENGIISVVVPGRNFVMPFDRLRYFEVNLLTPSPHTPQFRQARITLTPLTQNGLTEVVLPEIVNYEWKADQGLLLMFGRSATLGIHLDHIVAFHLEK